MACHSEDQANNFVMIGIPVPGSAKAPSINNVAYKIELFALYVAQEIHQRITPATAQSKMNIREKNSAIAPRR
jgi:hypothetical protein